MERIPKARIALTSATIGLASIALVTSSRRLAGTALAELPPGETVLYSAVFAASSLAAIQPLAGMLVPERQHARFPPIAALLLTLLLLAGLTVEPVAVLSGVVAATAVIGLATYPLRSGGAEAGRIVPLPATPTVNEASASPISRSEEATNEMPDAPQHHVELIRTLVDSDERVSGAIRFETPPGESTVTLHVPLWPPLAAPPRVRCELEDVDGRVSVPYAKPHGFRIVIRLPEPVDEPLEGTVRFLAETESGTAAA